MMFTASLTIQDLDFASPDDAARHLLEVAGWARPMFVDVRHQYDGTRCIVEVSDVSVSNAAAGVALARMVLETVDPACMVERDHPKADLADVYRAAEALIAKTEGR